MKIILKTPLIKQPTVRGEVSVPKVYIDFPNISYSGTGNDTYQIEVNQNEFNLLATNPDYEIIK